MVKSSTLSEMEKLTETLFLAEFAKLRPIIAAEAKIRHQLARLDEQATEFRNSSGHMFDYRAFGAEMSWRAWESRTRRALNMELSRLRAQKLAAMDSLHLAHGRRQATAHLASQLEHRSARRRGRVQLENLCLSEFLDPKR